MTTVAVIQGIVIVALSWLLHHTHRQEIKTIHGLLEQQDDQRNRDLERVDNLLRAQPAHMSQPHPDLAALIELTERLCQRLQAPAQAIVDHAIAQPLPDTPPTVRPDDDDGYWDALKLPKEDLAEMAAEGELNGA